MDLREMLQRDLNEPQWAAVAHGRGPALVVAGAGSGKTRVITYRIAYLVGVMGVPAWRVAAMTFTNKAAQEMRTRAQKLLGEDGQGLWLGTFHATCARILRQWGAPLGIPSHFTIYDTHDQQVLMKSCMAEMGRQAPRGDVKGALYVLDSLQNRGLDAKDGLDEAVTPYEQAMAALLMRYQERLHAAGAVDFGSLLVQTKRLLERHEEMRREVQRKWPFLLVDEFQDTNRVQCDILRLMSTEDKDVFAVGDEDQSIYGWRGATIENILHFDKFFPGAVVYILEQNYRSTRQILSTAHAVISLGSERRPKKLWTDRQDGPPAERIDASSERDEAGRVVDQIRKLMSQEGYHLHHFAIFYRTNAQSRSFEEALREQGLRYTIVGGLRFYDRAEIKDLIGYLRLATNPRDEVSFVRAINQPPRGIGAKTVDKILVQARARGEDPLQTALDQAAAGTIKGRQAKGVAQFARVIRAIREGGQKSASEAIVVALASSGLIDHFKTQGLEGEARVENLRELSAAVADFELANPQSGLDNFLEQVALVTSADQSSAGVVMMTLHAAKGLEFPVVFLTGLEEGTFPHSRTMDDPRQLEEERRLCYVGVTRAMDRLFVTWSANRRVGDMPFKQPSRFLSEMREMVKGTKLPSPYQRRAEQMREQLATWDGVDDVYDDQGSELVGRKVKHPSFGIGTIESVMGLGPDAKARVRFSDGDTKTVLARFLRPL